MPRAAAAPAVFPLSPPAVLPTPAPFVDQQPPGMPAAPRAPFSLAGLDQLASITLPVGLFFLFLEVIGTFLPWGFFSGIRGGNSPILRNSAVLLTKAISRASFPGARVTVRDGGIVSIDSSSMNCLRRWDWRRDVTFERTPKGGLSRPCLDCRGNLSPLLAP